jgi:hypothetical protein
MSEHRAMRTGRFTAYWTNKNGDVEIGYFYLIGVCRKYAMKNYVAWMPYQAKPEPYQQPDAEEKEK